MENPNEKNKKTQNSLPKANHYNCKTGLDKWNERLDENLEPNAHNDEVADEKAKNFSEKFGNVNEGNDAD